MPPTLTTRAEGLDILWSDGTRGTFPYIWRRDTDPAGFHPKTGERAFDLTSVPLDAGHHPVRGGAHARRQEVHRRRADEPAHEASVGVLSLIHI